MQYLLKWRAELSFLNILEQTFCCEVMHANAEGLGKDTDRVVPGYCPTWAFSCWWGPPQSWSSWPEEQVWHVRCSKNSCLGLLTSFRLWWAQECTTGTSRQHCPRSLYALWNLFPFLDPPLYHCFSSLFFSQVNHPALVIFPHLGWILQGQMGFAGSINREMVPSCQLRNKASPFLDAWSQTLLTLVCVKASRKWFIFFQLSTEATLGLHPCIKYWPDLSQYCLQLIFRLVSCSESLCYFRQQQVK